ILFAGGGQSQIDTWDPKPDAPAEVRGAFRSIATRVPGVRFCEHMPRIAARADRLAVVRSMSHDDLDHGSACYAALTGHFHARKSSNPDPKPTDMPTMGAIVRRLRAAGRLPYTAAHVNGPLLAPELLSAGQHAGFLGQGCEPLVVADPSDVGLDDLVPRPELPPVRVSRRRSLLESLDRYRRTLGDADELRRQAHAVLDNPHVRHAFDLGQEPRAVRERYGLHRSGQGCLLARRLVEAGVPYVVAFYHPSIRGQDKALDDTDAYGWDTHNDIFDALGGRLLPRFDATFAALLDDLGQRGLLESTLVVCMGEFGRAPLVALERTFAGSSPGRKHWGAAYSIALAGAGVRGGQVVGATDRRGAYPTTPPFSPADVSATVFDALGYDPAGQFRDALDRPWRIAEGKVMGELYG
ncbi:MAG: DUF1501 domain-containing protein, partial [Gemmataceae bacterium]